MNKYYWKDGGVTHGIGHLKGEEVDLNHPAVKRFFGSLVSAELIATKREIEKVEKEKVKEVK